MKQPYLLLLKYARAEQQHKKSKKRLLLSIKKRPQGIGKSFVNYYYWYTDFPIQVFCEWVGITQTKLLKELIEPLEFTKKCSMPYCSNEIKTQIKSRQQLKEFKKEQSPFCSDCGKDYKEFNSQCIEQKNREIFEKIEKEKSDKIETLRAMPYKEYLKTEHWSYMRKKKLRWVDYKCQLCNSEDKLEVHHRTYENLGCEEWIDLVVLCHRCHTEFFESRQKKEKENSLIQKKSDRSTFLEQQFEELMNLHRH